MLKTQAGLDDFVTEKYQDQIAAILAEWSAALSEASQDMQAVERILGSGFCRWFVPPGGIAAVAFRAGG